MSQIVPKDFFNKGLFRLPFSRFPSLFEDFENEMEQYASNQSGLSLSEDDNHIYVEAKMPGLKSDDIEITLENGILRIQGNREEEEKDKKRKYHRKSSSSYSYRLSLPSQADEGKPEACYKDGIMCITFPKLTARKGKKIPVKKG